MNDAKEQLLADGDIVMVPCVVVTVDNPRPGANRLVLKVLGQHFIVEGENNLHSLWGNQVIRANAGDDVSIPVEWLADAGKRAAEHREKLKLAPRLKAPTNIASAPAKAEGGATEKPADGSAAAGSPPPAHTSAG